MKRAFTLIELLVYIAIMSFIIIVAGRVFSDSTSMRVRSQSMLRSSEEVGKVAILLREDISQMGVKEWGKQTEDYDYKFAVHNEVYWKTINKDYSSYVLVRRKQQPNPNPSPVYADSLDSLVFKKAVFDNNSKFIAVREIALYAKRDSLFRKCREVTTTCPADAPIELCNGTTDNDCTFTGKIINDAPSVLIATGITSFKLTPLPAVSGNLDTLFPETFTNGIRTKKFKLFSRNASSTMKQLTLTNGDYGDYDIEVSGFDKTKFSELYLAEPVPEKTDWTKCTQMSFKLGETYVIEFEMRFDNFIEDPNVRGKYYNSTQFKPTEDHLSIGLRTNAGGKANNNAMPNDIFFYPPQTSDAKSLKRHLEFSVEKDLVNADKTCVAITVAFYSDAAEGILKFADFKVFRKADENFRSPKPEETNYGIGDDFIVTTANENEKNKKVNEKISVKAFELLLKIDYKGEKTGTFSGREKGMIIATPNNGIIPQN